MIEAQNKVIQEQKSKLSELEAKEPATKKDLEIVKLELQKEIEVVRKDIEVLRGETQKEIEIVRKEIVASKNSIIIWLGGVILGSGLLQHFFR